MYPLSEMAILVESDKKLLLDKYKINREGELVTDTPLGRFSPIDIVNTRAVRMTKTLVDKRAEFRNKN